MWAHHGPEATGSLLAQDVTPIQMALTAGLRPQFCNATPRLCWHDVWGQMPQGPLLETNRILLCSVPLAQAGTFFWLAVAGQRISN